MEKTFGDMMAVLKKNRTAIQSKKEWTHSVLFQRDELFIDLVDRDYLSAPRNHGLSGGTQKNAL